MRMMNAAQLWREAQARAELQHAARRRAQEQRDRAWLTAPLDRPHGPHSAPAITGWLWAHPGWPVLCLVYADDTVRVAVARRTGPPRGAVIWARGRPLRVVVQGWLHDRRTPAGRCVCAYVAKAWELVEAAAGAGRAG